MQSRTGSLIHVGTRPSLMWDIIAPALTGIGYVWFVLMVLGIFKT